jgi:hypothetical protein
VSCLLVLSLLFFTPQQFPLPNSFLTVFVTTSRSIDVEDYRSADLVTGSASINLDLLLLTSRYSISFSFLFLNRSNIRISKAGVRPASKYLNETQLRIKPIYSCYLDLHSYRRHLCNAEDIDIVALCMTAWYLFAWISSRLL